MSLVAVETHTVQYHAPVYRYLDQKVGIPTTAVYGSDFSISGYKDREFGTQFSWDIDLLSGYKAVFLSKTSQENTKNYDNIQSGDLWGTLGRLDPEFILIGGYSQRLYRSAVRWFLDHSVQSNGRGGPKGDLGRMEL